MKVTYISVIVIILLVIGVAIAGCSSSGTPAPSTTGTPPGGPAVTTSAAQSSGQGSSSVAGSVIGADKILPSIPYNWIEYKTATNAGGTQMVSYLKFDKQGTCTMRMEGAGLPGGSMTIDCSVKGGQTQQDQQSNPNAIKSDVQFVFAGVEPVTVPAGTYPIASKYTVTSQGVTVTYWTAPNVPGFVKYQMNTGNGLVVTELNGWG